MVVNLDTSGLTHALPVVHLLTSDTQGTVVWAAWSRGAASADGLQCGPYIINAGS